MRISFLPLVVLLLLLQSCGTGNAPEQQDQADSKTPNDITGQFYLPPPATAGEGAYLSGELLYPLDDKPTPECHASTIEQTPSGLVCAFFAGTEEGDNDVGIRVSRLVDGKWTRPVEVVNGVQNEQLRYPCWNPVLFQAADGPLLLFYKVGPNPRDWWGMLTTSTDGGQSWSEPSKLGEDEKIGHLLGPVKNKPIQLADGSILCPSSTERQPEGGDIEWRVHFERTTDLGKTWEVVGPINDGVEFDAIQPSILTYADGRMQVLCRTREGVVAQSWSEDQGQHWAPMTGISLPNPNAGTDAVTLKDGRQLLVYNHTHRGGKTESGRYMLNVALSDNGTDWTPVLTLEDDTRENAGYSYPAVIQSTDGLVHITYTYERVSVKHAVLDPSKLLASD